MAATLARMPQWLVRLLGVPRTEKPNEKLKAEIEAPLEESEREYQLSAMTPIDTRLAARHNFGSIERVDEDYRDRLSFLGETSWRVFCHALRTFAWHKRTYLAVSAILALGIGMSVAMFSLVDAVLLRPLPFPRQESLYVVWKADPLAGDHVEEMAYPELRDLQSGVRGFEYVALTPPSLYGNARVLQMEDADPVQLEAAPVSHDYFRVLGVSPVLGRDFASSDEQVGAPPVVVISDRVWRNHLGADVNIVGQMIRLNGQGHTVIGVMAPGVEFPRGANLWVPLGVERRVVESRTATFLHAIARARAGYTQERLENEVNALFRRLAAEYPEAYSPTQHGVVMPLVEYWTGSARVQLLIMLGASLLLLLASCITAGNLLLSRTLSRRYEVATRLALGAQRGQILGQLAAEGIVVATVAAVGGLGIGHLAIRFLVGWAPRDIPRLPEASLDLNSFCFAAGTAGLAAMVCSLVPGWSATRIPLDSVLREGGIRSSMSRRTGKAADMFILAQGATTVVLLAVAVLLVLSYRSMISETGFANRDTVTMEVQRRGPGLFPGQSFDKESRHAFYSRLLDRARGAPGVSSAAAILMRPLEGLIGWDRPYQFGFEAGNQDDRTLPKANYEVATPGYFETVGTPLLEGRDFDEHDSEDAEPVAIISRTLADRIRVAGHRALGHPIRIGPRSAQWRRIVGICSDARYRHLSRRGADIFVPYLQATPVTKYVVVRGTQSANEISALVRRALKEIDPTQAVGNVATIGELIDRDTAPHRFNIIVLLWFGICAAALAAAGVVSVTAERVATQKQEIAIRSALGAQPHQLVRDIVSRTLRFALIGQILGALAVASLSMIGSELLYGISAYNPAVLISVIVFLFIVSLGAASWPAWIAASDDPKTSLHVN